MPDNWLRYVRSQIQRFQSLRLPHDPAKPPGPPAQDLLWTVQLGIQRFWRLRWRIKGPVLATLLFFAFIGAHGVIAGGGGGNNDSPTGVLAGNFRANDATDTPTRQPTSVPTPSPAPMLTIDYPADGAVINKADLLICGSASPGAVVGRNIRFQPDPKMTADRTGHWEYKTTLVEGDHDFEFYLDDSQDTRATVKVIYSPGAPVSPLTACPSQPGSTIATEPTVAPTPLPTLAPTLAPPPVTSPPTAIPTPPPPPAIAIVEGFCLEVIGPATNCHGTIENLTQYIMVDLSVQITFADGRQTKPTVIAGLLNGILPGQQYQWEVDIQVAETDANNARPALTFFDDVGSLPVRDDRAP